jgi:hypothetical protein
MANLHTNKVYNSSTFLYRLLTFIKYAFINL